MQPLAAASRCQWLHFYTLNSACRKNAKNEQISMCGENYAADLHIYVFK
jgi:hypothetical protein